jgi:hypothetical protein
MTTLSISRAFRHVAAAFGNERAQQKLAQQKRDRETVQLLSVKPIDMDRVFRIPPFESGLSGGTRPTLQEINNLLKGPPLKPPSPASTAHSQPQESVRAVATQKHRQTSAPSPETARVAPAHPAPKSAVRLSSVSAAAAEGGWLHSHWKPSAAGVAALAGQRDSPDAPRAPAAAIASAIGNAREDAGNAGTFQDRSWMRQIAQLGEHYLIPRPTLNTAGTSDAPPPAPAAKQTQAARSNPVPATKEVIPSKKRRRAPPIPLTPQAAVPVAKQTSPAAARQKAPPVVIPKPTIAVNTSSTTTTTTPPTPPPLPPALSPVHVDLASSGLFKELKNVTLAKSTSLDSMAKMTSGTRTRRASEGAQGTPAGAERQGLIEEKKISRPTASDELRKAVAKRREKLGYKPEKPKVASDRPPAIQPHSDPRSKSAETAVILAKPKREVFGAPDITAALKFSMVAELQAKLALRAQ